jgi:hypothetical protein
MSVVGTFRTRCFTERPLCADCVEEVDELGEHTGAKKQARVGSLVLKRA